MSLVSRFATGEYKVKRMSRGTYVKGRYSPGPVEEILVEGSLQPTNARELKLPEEGNRLKQFWKLYSDQQVVVNSAKSLADSDIVTVNGEEYRAYSLDIWQNTDLDYFMTILWREPSQDSDGKASG